MAKNFSLNRKLIYQELFYFFSAALALFILLEIIWPNIILAYFNLNYLVILWLLSALGQLFKK